MMFEPYYANGDPGAPLHLSYLRAVAQGPECPDWSENVGRDPQNMPYPKFRLRHPGQFCRHGR